MPLKLTIRKEGEPTWGDIREFGQAEITIGRGSDNTLWLEDQGKVVSRHHARIVFQENDYFISDLGSRNATLINGSKIMANLRYRLSEGDVIRIGDYLLEYHAIDTFSDQTDPTILMINPFEEDAKILINALRKMQRTFDGANPQSRVEDLKVSLMDGLRDAGIGSIKDEIANLLFNSRSTGHTPAPEAPATPEPDEEKAAQPRLPGMGGEQRTGRHVIQPFHKAAEKRAVDVSLLQKDNSN